MGKLSDNKLAKLNALDAQGGFWYITKQNLVFRDLCFMAKILEAWGDRKEESYQSFFDSHKEMKEFGSLPPLTAHRATKNCEYIGLIRPSNNYKAENLTPFYFALKNICEGDFDRLSSYSEIINKQLERMFVDSNTNDVYTVNFQICPFMFLFKVLLLIGDITKSYKISKSEFKLFVATAQSWMEYFEVVESILRYREDTAYRAQCDINSAKVSDVRYNILAENHSQISVVGSEISITESEIKNVRRKVAEYELTDKIHSAEDIFEPINNQGVSSDTSADYLKYLTALRAKPFMLLAGISGTGKSRIVREFAFKSCPPALQDAEGTTPGNYCMIEVKPNWHDSTEILGYYSNIAERYQYTKFVKFLVKAMMFPNVPFFVCLDEMNLAPVEQYFAEFLSVLETRKKDDATGVIQSGVLVDAKHFKEYKYTDAEGNKHVRTNLTDLDWYKLFFTNDEITEELLTKQYATNLQDKGLSLPDNVFIIGTVNMDDTTHQFSRKVIDRAMTIEMNGGKLEDMFGHSADLQYLPEDQIMELSDFKPEYVNADEVMEAHSEYAETLQEKLVEKLDAINNCLKNTPFQVSYRVLNELCIYAGVLLDDGRELDDAISKAVDQITLMKILPRIEGDEDMFVTKDGNKLEQLQEILGKDSASGVKLEEMKERLKNSSFTRFWP